MALRKGKTIHSTGKVRIGGGSHKQKKMLTFTQVAKGQTPKPGGKLAKHKFQV